MNDKRPGQAEPIDFQSIFLSWPHSVPYIYIPVQTYVRTDRVKAVEPEILHLTPSYFIINLPAAPVRRRNNNNNKTFVKIIAAFIKINKIAMNFAFVWFCIRIIADKIGK